MRALAYAWAAPYSAVGAMLALAVVLSGGRARMHRGVLECAGGALGRAFSHLPAPLAFSAITVGHVVLGLDHATLAAVREHERVHVGQYERWGPLFVPAYLVAGLIELLRGRRAYRDNYFERQAYGDTDRPADPAA
ncbi:MAG: signal peptide prediction [Ramlibacter sp.]|nr:signal peptide prediction [Ramlibacter sp.]